MNLTKCFKKLGISGAEADHIRTIAQEYRDDGMSAADANKEALQDYLEDLHNERDNVVQQVHSKLGPPPQPAITPERVAEVGGEQAGFEAKRGVINWQETEKLAEKLGLTPDHLKRLIDREAGKTFNVEELEGAARAVDETYQRTHEQMVQLAQKIEQGRITDEELAAAAEAFVQTANIGAQWTGVSGEAGRALQILRKHQDTKSKAEVLRDLAEGQGGMDMLKAKIIAFSRAGSPTAAAQVARDTMKVTKWDKFMEYYYFSLLSGVPTHVVNVVSTGFQGLVQEIDNFIAAGIGKITGSQDRITFNEVKARLGAVGTGANLGIREAVRVFKDFEGEGFEEFGPTKIDYPQKRAIKGTKGKVFRFPMRMLSTEDTFWKAMLYNMGIAQFAEVEAKRTGKPAQFFIDNPTDMMKEQAWKQAKQGTFTEEAGDIGKAIKQLRKNVPIFNLVFPFVQTPGNILKVALKHSFMAPIFKDVRADFEAGGRRRDLALAKIGVGSAIGLTGFALAAAGKIVGQPPEDANERRLWYRQGKQPNSIKVGDQWVSFSRIEPLGMLLGIFADAHQFADRFTVDEAGEMWSMVMGSIASNLTSKTYLRGLTDVINVIQEPERYGERYIHNFLSTLAVPVGVSYMAKAYDDKLRQAETIVDAVKRRVPGLSETLPERLDIFGDTVKSEGTPVYRFFSPAYLKTSRNDQVANELLAYDVSFPAIGKSFRGVELTPEQRNSLVELTGKPAYQILQKVIQSSGYQQLPGILKQRVLEKVIRDVRADAREYWVHQYPDLMRAIHNLKLQKYGAVS